MAEWRDILDRAADNLSVDLNQRSQISFGRQPAGMSAQRPGVGQMPFVASRDLLARELDTFSNPAQVQQRPQMRRPQQSGRAAGTPAAAHRAAITQAIGQLADVPAVVPVQAYAPPAAAKKSGPVRELTALSISVGIVALSVYGFFVLLH